MLTLAYGNFTYRILHAARTSSKHLNSEDAHSPILECRRQFEHSHCNEIAPAAYAINAVRRNVERPDRAIGDEARFLGTQVAPNRVHGPVRIRARFIFL